MAEKLKSISEARQNLPGLSQTAQKQMDRYIITHQGQPQSVLLGYQEYQGLKAATELVHRPEIIEDIKTGLNELASGKRLSPDEARNLLRVRVQSSETNKLASELASESGFDAKTAAAVMNKLYEKILADFSSTGQISIPGVATIMVKDVRAGKPVAGVLPNSKIGTSKRRKNRNKYLAIEPAPAVQNILLGNTEK